MAIPHPPLDQRRLLEVIAFQAEATGAAADPEQTMQLACDRAQSVTEADGAVVGMADGEDLVSAIGSGTLVAHTGARVKLDASLTGLAVRTGELQRSDDCEHDPRVNREVCRRFGIASMLCVPLLHDGEAVGVLEVVSSRRRVFDVTDVAVLRLLGNLIAAAMTQASLIRQLREQAMTDPLTGLPNRRRWDEELGAALVRSKRSHVPVAVCVLDLSGFKAVNDTYGHEAGDRLLQGVAAGWAEATRAGELLARIGGDEFAILLGEFAPASGPRLANRLRDALPAGQAVSIGIATSRAGDTVETLMQRADQDMYADKRGRRSPAIA